MKRIKRNPEKFEPIELFAAIGREHGFRLNEEADLNGFMEIVKRSLADSTNDKKMIHGRRVEFMFAHVAGALGRCDLIKKEDSGDVYTSKNIAPPDYSLIIDSGERFFVEVKNFHSKDFLKKFSMRVSDYKKLERYAELNGLSLKIAIYFSAFNKWSLLSKEAFSEESGRYEIDLPKAIAASEMASIGDRTIGTKPSLCLELLFRDPVQVDSEEVVGVIGEANFYCAGKKIDDDMEKGIVLNFMRFGDWEESEPEPVYSKDCCVGVRFYSNPVAPNEEQGFDIVGQLSTMVSRAYSEHTVHDRKVIALDAKQDPDVFSIFIPENYKSNALPLWQLIIKPNYEFVSESDALNPSV